MIKSSQINQKEKLIFVKHILTLFFSMVFTVVSAQFDTTYSPPVLTNPTEIVLSKGSQTAQTSSSEVYCGSGKIYELSFADDEDALITFDGGDALPYPVIIHGGRNVIIRGLEMVMETQPGQEPGTRNVGGKTNPHAIVPTCRGLGLDTKNAKVHWVEGLHLDMKGHDADAIVVNGRRTETGIAKVMIQNSLIEGLEGSDILHGDILQLQTGTIKDLIFENVTMKQSSEGITISYPVPVPSRIDASKLVLIDKVTLRNMDYHVDTRYIADDADDERVYGHFFAGMNNMSKSPAWIMVKNFSIEGGVYINHSNPANQYWFMIKDKHFTSPDQAGKVIYGVTLESHPEVHYNQSPSQGSYAKIADVGRNYSSTLATDEFQNAIDVLISPNPSSEELNIQFPEVIDIERISIYDVLGKEVFAKKIEALEAKLVLNLNLAKGIYMVTIASKKGKFNKKIIIELYIRKQS